MDRVKELTDELVPLVDAFLHSDPFINAYAIWELHHLRHRAKFFVLIEDERLKGLLLDYLGHVGVHFIWLWGEEDAIEKLLDLPLPEKAVFCVFPELESIIKQKFSIIARYSIDFMLLKKGEERLYLRHEIAPLSLEDAYALASLRNENPSEEEIKCAESLIREKLFTVFSLTQSSSQ